MEAPFIALTFVWEASLKRVDYIWAYYCLDTKQALSVLLSDWFMTYWGQLIHTHTHKHKDTHSLTELCRLSFRIESEISWIWNCNEVLKMQHMLLSQTTAGDLVSFKSNTHILCCLMYPIILCISFSMAAGRKNNKLTNSLWTNVNLHMLKYFVSDKK